MNYQAKIMCLLKEKMYSLGVLVLIIATAGFVTPNKTLAKPSDGLDDQPALQAQIDALASKGGGVIGLKQGTYDLSRPLYLRDSVELTGMGATTILTNELFNQNPGWFGTTVFAGNLAPASFVSNGGLGHDGHLYEQAGQKKISIPNCKIDDLANLASTVVWLASTDSIKGRGDFSRPIYNEMNLVARVDGCVLYLADVITIPANVSAKIYWSSGTTRVHKKLEPNHPIRNATLSNIQLRSAAGQALISSGCYTCSFSKITMGRTRRLLGVQGARNSIYREISGEFYERGIEVTMFANGNFVKTISGRYVPKSDYKPRPAIRFGEYPRNNLIEDVTLNLIDDAGLLRIRFEHSESNHLKNIKMYLQQNVLRKNIDRLLQSMEELPSNTTISDFSLCAHDLLSGKNNCISGDYK